MSSSNTRKPKHTRERQEQQQQPQRIRPSRQGSFGRSRSNNNNDNDNDTCSGFTSSTYYSDGGMPVSQHSPLSEQQQQQPQSTTSHFIPPRLPLHGGKAPRRGSGGGIASGGVMGSGSINRRSNIRTGIGLSNNPSKKASPSPFKVTFKQSLKPSHSSTNITTNNNSSTLPPLPSSTSKTSKKTISFKPIRYVSNYRNDDASIASEVSDLSYPTLSLGYGIPIYNKHRYNIWIPTVLFVCILGFLVGDYITFAATGGAAAGLSAEDRMIVQQLKFAKYNQNQQHQPPSQIQNHHASLRRQGEERNPPKATVAYVLPIYTCPSFSSTENDNDLQNDDIFHNAALMLKASIHRQSYKNAHSGSVYDYEMIAILHPSVIKCDAHGQNRADVLRDLGYIVQVREEPVKVGSIQGEYLRGNIDMDGGVDGGGIHDLIRLHAYKLTQYAVVTLVDFTTLVLQPPDDMFNLILDGGTSASSYMSDATKQHLPARVDVVYTRDYTTVTPKQRTTGMNLSFLPLRPSLDAYNEMIHLYTERSDAYDPELGWGSLNEYGPFRGSMLTKGLLTYYHTHIHPHSHVELLHRCKYVNMADAPRVKLEGGGDDTTMACRDPRETNVESCTDCRFTSLEDVVIADMSECGAPWTCGGSSTRGSGSVASRYDELCNAFHSTWFELRKEVEEIVLGENIKIERGESLESLYCSDQGSYVPLLLPSQGDEVIE